MPHNNTSFYSIVKLYHKKNILTLVFDIKKSKNLSCLYYNEPKKRTRDVIWLASLNARSFTELYQILKGVLSNKELTKFLKDVINMSLEDFNLHEWQREKLDDLVAYNREQHAMKTGIEQNTIDIVKELLKNNIEIDIISKVTKKSIDEINQIKNSLKN